MALPRSAWATYCLLPSVISPKSVVDIEEALSLVIDQTKDMSVDEGVKVCGQLCGRVTR